MPQPLDITVAPFRVTREQVGAMTVHVTTDRGERIACASDDFAPLAIAMAEEVNRLRVVALAALEELRDLNKRIGWRDGKWYVVEQLEGVLAAVDSKGVGHG